MAGKLTPMMRQYNEIKKRLPGKLLFFRLGDFYEMFFEDAIVASRELEITLTSRNKDSKGAPIPMCGVPHHAVDSYIARLIKKGYKVAICDQVEEPRPGRIVKREIVRIVSPGTVTDEVMLEPKNNNFLSCILQREDAFGVAFLDVSTGEFYATQYNKQDATNTLSVELNHFQPAEIIFPKSNATLFQQNIIDTVLENTARTPVADWIFEYEYSSRILKTTLGVTTLDGYGLRDKELAICAAGAIIHYVNETNKISLGNIIGIIYFQHTDYLRLDTESVANLELIKSTEGSRKNTLLQVLDFTKTNMGGRLLKNWILRPLMNINEINNRLEAVEELTGNYLKREKLQSCLGEIQDIERLTGKVTSGTVRPRDLLALKSSISVFPDFLKILQDLKSNIFKSLAGDFDILEDIFSLLDNSISDNPPLNLSDGNVIKNGYSHELDSLRNLASGGKTAIVQMEAKEKERTGIQSLKIGYNKVFGYYIEVTKPNLHLVPEHYIRKQTLANTERFVTSDLKEYEESVLTAEEKMVKLERELFNDIRLRIAEQSRRLLLSARIIAIADVLASLAEAAIRYNYCRPEIVNSNVIEYRDGRHPVIEHIEESFIPNDCMMDNENHQLIILTGPNMGGKSTYLRQTALLVIMAQMGSFVPASWAQIGLVDQIFTRVGASDNLARGRSTFMLEMIETANILNTCTPRSLILLDEVGRGTATFDGLSIAWSVAEYLHNEPSHKAKTLFATHYHEMTKLEFLYDGIKNYCVTVKEGGGEIIFLRKVKPGTANKSYGIDVAKLAGMPQIVVQRAKQILHKLEKKEIDLSQQSKGISKKQLREQLQKRLF